ncbi:SAM-dependent methyltransferase [Sphingomonas japonica]|uniref:SAM-dependent methyltransferase n=1 Tax=Sphingomonas japonica TaxID=511662 RepID=A0ABX0TXN2_9SPHN|nr:SAM-dependent methyltransferase [Sphingomonas japonica]NIJ23069.1 SAM-dependent methyltransferase [Sphingomonas japonica]
MHADASLGASYFNGIFASSDDPWSLATSAYEDAKFARTIAALGGRRAARAIEIGCAHGVLTQRIAPLCDALLAIDISARAVELARKRCGALPQVRFAVAGFPADAPPVTSFDLAILSEVVYYWSDADIDAAGEWLAEHVVPGGRILLVHYTGETNYPQTGDGAVTALADTLGEKVAVVHSERAERYRLDLWLRR